MKYFFILILAATVALSAAQCETAASQSIAYGPGVVGGPPPIWQKNKLQTYHIQAICADGTKRTSGGDIFAPGFNPTYATDNGCTDLNDGTYYCTYLPFVATTISLNIKFKGKQYIALTKRRIHRWYARGSAHCDVEPPNKTDFFGNLENPTRFVCNESV